MSSDRADDASRPARSEPQASEVGRVLGTAGHIDHGKTALIRALTGVDTDRLPEEKARGITIELGFAPLDLGDGLRLSVVDVPGHEKLVRTMVAGASGIDLVLLVVAADEGVMPQTREHVAVCQLLGIGRGVVALSKRDLVEEDVLALAREEVERLLAGTALEGADAVPVSATTGDGLDALRAALAKAARDAPARTPRRGPPRLPVDRVFALRGFGTVVTGTLVGGRFAAGDAVEILPSGRRARVRGLQSHGAAARSVEPGARCALNLQGVEVAEIERGEVVTLPGALPLTCSFDARMVWLASAPPLEEPASVELLAGTAERRARLAPIGPRRAQRLAPGAAGFARLHLEGDALALLPGDRFVVRGFARSETGATLGGGVVLDARPPRRRRSDPSLARELEALAAADGATQVRVRVARAGLSGAAPERLARELGLSPDECGALLAKLAGDGAALGCGSGPAEVWLSVEALDELERRLLAALDAFHAAEPLRPGMPRAALRGALPENVPPDAAERALERASSRGALVLERDLARRPDHAPRIDEETRALLGRLRQDARAAGLDPPAPREWAERLDVAPERLRELFAHLEREGALVRAPGDLWFDRDAVDALRERVQAHLRRHGRLATPDYKALIGTARRTAVPLMELFDEEKLTRRDGNARVLRRPDSG